MIISFEGLPGCRKNEIYNHLGTKLNLNILRMNDKDRALHHKFLKNPKENAFLYELNRLMSIVERTNENTVQNSQLNTENSLRSSSSGILLTDSINSETDLIISNTGPMGGHTSAIPSCSSPALPANPAGEALVVKLSGNVFNPNDQIMTDSSYSLRNVYIDYLKHCGWINEEEYSIFDRIYRSTYKVPQVMIYFFGSFENCYRRMLEEAKTDPENQYVYSEEEFKKLHYQYEWIFDTNNCQIPIYKVSVEDDIDSIIGNIKEILERIDILF
tara:strand:- start:11298 stop:12113 length:816 start_codon:yes stop_codon:yes gene_type:complete